MKRRDDRQERDDATRAQDALPQAAVTRAPPISSPTFS